MASDQNPMALAEPGRRAHAAARQPAVAGAAAWAAGAVGAGWAAQATGHLPGSLAVALSAGAVTATLITARRREKRTRDQADQAARSLRATADRETAALLALDEVAAQRRRFAVNAAWAARMIADGRGDIAFQPAEEPALVGNPVHDVPAQVAYWLDRGWQDMLGAGAERERKRAHEVGLTEVVHALTPRVQALVKQAIALLDAVENMVEDPDLLDPIYGVDHLMIRLRREAESQIVLAGGSLPRLSTPMELRELLRVAAQQVAHFNRVRVVPSSCGDAVPGYAARPLAHLLSGLLENATDSSGAGMLVEADLTRERAGVIIEIRDRGLGIEPSRMAELNSLLAAPHEHDTGKLLAARTLGLLVVALLARPLDITVHLEALPGGGTRAVVRVPARLLRAAPSESPPPAPASRPGSSAADETQVLRRVSPRPSRASGLIPSADGRPPLPRRAPSAMPAAGAAPAQAPTGTPTPAFTRAFMARRPLNDQEHPHD
ncbi:ATP-binding protein [Streptomyces diastaticus]|uniref:ATP-binding protein n=2 Tax=Streptomyces diastaticus TaxID=1956 RepID=UPI001672992E|nr:ATP-binding protein [Streptomyces diastaticus]GGU43046.1 hypothetical protein GCM10015534_51940 [Streptomyces diastaticus subsp. diastaticus]